MQQAWWNVREESLGYDQQLPLRVRRDAGQFYSPNFLCDWMLALLNPQPGERLLEPGCGSGTFLKRAYERAQALFPGSDPVACLSTLHGIEQNEEAICLARQQLAALANVSDAIPKLVSGNFLDPTLETTLGRFDVIIGNPPYVRQEFLSQKDAQGHQEALARLKCRYVGYLEAYPQQRALFTAQADLYIAFFLQSTLYLNPGGRLAFVTSNSWLNTAFGQLFRQFLHHFFSIRLLAESACERWFSEAAVNAIVVVLEKRPQFLRPACLRDAMGDSEVNESVRVLRLFQPLSDVLPSVAEEEYWQRLQSQTDALWAQGGQQQFSSTSECDGHMLEWAQVGSLKGDFQTKLFSINHLLKEPFSRNWGLVLRAPESLRTWLDNERLWVRLDQLGTVRYPLKTGINQFFYLTAEQAAHWRIEPEFLFPVMRSSRAVKRWAVRSADCLEYVFSCLESMETLAQRRKIGALAYIRWGEKQMAPPRQKRTQATPWPQVASVQNRRFWYALPPLSPPHLLCNRFLDQRFFFARCDEALMEDQTFYGVTFSDASSYLPDFLAALLNSTLSFLLLEFNARNNLGEGVLQYARCDMAAFPVIQPALYTQLEQQGIVEAFRYMTQRPIKPLPEELTQPDRQHLDTLVLRPLLPKLDQWHHVEDYRIQIVSDLLTRLAERKKIARSV